MTEQRLSVSRARRWDIMSLVTAGSHGDVSCGMMATVHFWHALPIQSRGVGVRSGSYADVLRPTRNLLRSRRLSQLRMYNRRMMTGTEIAAGTETGTETGTWTGIATMIVTGTETATAAAIAIATGSAAAAAKGTWIAVAAAGTGTGIGIGTGGAAAGTGTGIDVAAAETGTAGVSVCDVSLSAGAAHGMRNCSASSQGAAQARTPADLQIDCSWIRLKSISYIPYKSVKRCRSAAKS